MTKDRVNYRASRKFALGSYQAERSIGITALHNTVYSEVDTRSTALMKWSFDDFIVEETFPSQAMFQDVSLQSSSSDTPQKHDTSLVVKVLSEGVPDTILETLFQRRCPNGVSFHFLSPVDFVSCTLRHVWIRDASEVVQKRFHSQQVLHTVAGDVYVFPAVRIRVPSSAAYFPLHWLPNLRYTLFLRDIRGCLNDLLPGLKSLSARGFMNYGHMARHGHSTLQSYNAAKALLKRDYVAFLQHYVQTLSEGTSGVQQELSFLLDTLAKPDASRRDWHLVLEGMETALRQDHAHGMRASQTGLYMPHHSLLKDFITRAADVAPRYHDSAQVIRESVSRVFLQEVLRTASEVDFNALASLRRAQRGGDRVMVGDLVGPVWEELGLKSTWSSSFMYDRREPPPHHDDNNNSSRKVQTSRQQEYLEHGTRARHQTMTSCSLLWSRDFYEAPADHINGSILSPYTHPDWVDLAFYDVLDRTEDTPDCYRIMHAITPREGADLRLPNFPLRTVQTQAEADACHISQVLLPFWGRQVDGLPCLPEHHLGRLFRPLARELQIEGLTSMQTASKASYRHLVVKPIDMAAYIFDAQRGWDWVEGGLKGEALKERIYQDSEGIYRIRSPLLDLSSKHRVARQGIQDAAARRFFLKPAQKQSMNCVVQFTLPRGSPVTSALREVFQFITLSPSAIFRLLKY